MLQRIVRAALFASVIAWIPLGSGCNPHQSEDAARQEVKEQEEIRKKQEIEDAAANIELRQSEKK